MIEAGLIAAGVSVLCSIVFEWVTNRVYRARLYSLEADIAELQERHLRHVRKNAALQKWENEDQLDMNIAEAVAATPKKKGWTKWPSSDRSENSSEM